MKNWSIDNKLWLCVLIPTLISGLCFTLLFVQSFFYQFDQGFIRRGELYNNNLITDLNILSGGLSQQNVEDLVEPKIRNQGSLLSLTIYDLKKEVSYQFGQTPDKTILQPEAFDQLQTDTPHIVRDNESSYFFQAISNPDNGSIQGWVAVEWDRRSLQLQRYRLIVKLGFIAALGLVLAVLVFMYLKRNIVQPLSSLRGNLEHLSYGEVEKLTDIKNGQPFDLFSNYIQHTGDLIKSSRQELQDTVDQATADLRETLDTVEVQNVELNMARKQALAANKAKSEFLSNTSHEIRTPINGILGFVQLLLKSSLDEQQQEYLRNIEKSSQGLLTAINSIIDVSKIETGQLVLDYNPFDLTEVIEDSVDIFKPAAEQKNLSIRFMIATTVPRSLMGDGLRLKQILCNLISNAIKFSSQGDIVVKVSQSELSHQKLNPPENTGNNLGNRVDLLFTVEDQGSGIETSAQQGLFQLFSQVDSSNSREHGGSGLGLAVSKGLVELMKGEIGVDSKVDKGSTFWFRVRFGINQSFPSLNKNISPASSSKTAFSANILAVDDTPANLQVIGEFLKDLGAATSLASSGQEALELIQQKQFDMIFMDIQMPNMDGLETTRRIRQLESPPNRTPIIALTAHAMTDQKTDLLLAGLDDYLSKPISENQLLHVIKRWVKDKPYQTPKKTRNIAQAHTPVKQTHKEPETDNYKFGLVDIQLCLKLSNNKPDLARDMLAMLLKDLPSQIELISNHKQEGNISALEEIVHKVRGGASYCGVPQLKNTSTFADELLRKQQVDDNAIKALLESMNQLVEWNEEIDIDALFGLETTNS